MSGPNTDITLCIPVYNAMPFLPDTVASVLNQTFRDFRILIIDDGSTDESLTYLRTITDPRVTLIAQENRGLTATLNRMLEILGTGWLVRQDADDIAKPTRLRRIHEYIEQYPQAGMIYSQAGHFQNGSIKGLLLTTPVDETGLRSFLKKGYLPSICHPSLALRVDAALAVGGYRFDLHVEDYDLYWRMGLDFDAHLIPEVLLGYRMIASSISDQNSRKQATNVLYVQYLLLSRLWRKRVQPYEEVLPVLQGMVNIGHLNFRKSMRSAMVNYGAKQYGRFALKLMTAFLSSPPSFVNRFLQRNTRIAKVGISPERFETRAALLWPNP